MHWTDVGVNLTAASLAMKAAEVVAGAHAAGVTRLVLIGTSVAESEKAAELAHRFSGCVSTAGIHPHDAAQADDNFQSQLVQLLTHEQVRAIGECGLDYNRNYSPPDVQRKIFAAQLELAAELQLPVYLHEREAIRDQLDILDRYLDKIPAAVAHCFTGTAYELAAYQERGLYIGVTGWVCDERRGQALQAAVPDIAADRLLLETDAPYLMPRTIRPRPKSRNNTPANLPWVAERVAQLRACSLTELAAQTNANAERLFGAWEPIDG
ncbi:MAG: TatD family hydrolase [Aliidiomarina sp.]|nr:TatD family hydrolase [Aliidiomarina sp.]MCH8500876.1 TatD family hydrolase [Aliidiomarina sp.]